MGTDFQIHDWITPTPSESPRVHAVSLRLPAGTVDLLTNSDNNGRFYTQFGMQDLDTLEAIGKNTALERCTSGLLY